MEETVKKEGEEAKKESEEQRAIPQRETPRKDYHLVKLQEWGHNFPSDLSKNSLDIGGGGFHQPGVWGEKRRNQDASEFSYFTGFFFLLYAANLMYPLASNHVYDTFCSGRNG